MNRNAEEKKSAKQVLQECTVTVRMSDDFSRLLDTIPVDVPELQVRLVLTEADLNRATGDRIAAFLSALKRRHPALTVIRPLPRCVLGLQWQAVSTTYAIPRDCADCGDLFTAQDGTLVSCAALGARGPNHRYLREREQVWEFFNTLRLQKEPLESCSRCLHFLRKTCDGLCFRR